MSAAAIHQADIEPSMRHDPDRAHDRVVDPFVGVAEHPAAHAGQQHNVRLPVDRGREDVDGYRT